MKHAIVLLSGGLDSTTTLYYAQTQGYKTHALIFDYGQRHRKEITQAKRIARLSGSDYCVIKMALPWRGSALLDKKMALPQNRRIIPWEIPVTYVPARNIIFLSFAASYAEVMGAQALFIGANAIDYSGYPDCRPEFFAAYERMITRGMKIGVEGRPLKIYAPLVRKTKAQIVRLALKLKIPFHLTWSCYKGGKRPCGRCDSCLLRQKGFEEAGIEDPLDNR